MSAMDKGKGFYEYYDITDPTPYETDSTIFEDDECALCGKGFHKGDEILMLSHRSITHDRFWMHRNCLMERMGRLGISSFTALDVLDELEFEVEEWEEE